MQILVPGEQPQTTNGDRRPKKNEAVGAVTIVQWEQEK
jgi:hypothetical protein